LRPITGAPTFIAMSITLQIFSAKVSDSEPPKTVKSCAKTKTGRPSTRPCPVTIPSPGMRFFSMSKSWLRWTTSASSSWNEPGSSRASIRSRAVSLPASCWRAMRSSPPPLRAAA
jgi:hypothetical protein